MDVVETWNTPSSGPTAGGILGPQSGLLKIFVTYFKDLKCGNVIDFKITSWHLTVVSWLILAQRLPSARAILNKPTIGMQITEEKVMHHPTVFAQSG